jgi:hypothetical protein
MDWEARSFGVHCRWQSRDGSCWRVEFELFDAGGRVECVGVHIRSWSPDEASAPHPLLARTLRELPFAGVLARTLRNEAGRHERQAGETDAARSPEASELLARLQLRFAHLLAPPEHMGVRHATYTYSDLERVAEVYKGAFAITPATPTKDVAAALGISRNQAAKLVQRCRSPRIGLLAPTEKGIAGGILPSPPADQEGDHDG